MPKNLQGCYEVTMFRLLVRPQRPPVGGRELAALDAAGEGQSAASGPELL